MTKIISPHCGRTLEHQSMLLAIVRWLGEPSILQYAVHDGIRRNDLKLGLAAVQSTLDGMDVGPVTSLKAAKLLLDLLERKHTRKAIIRFEVKRCGLGRRQAVEDVRAIRLECVASIRSARSEAEAVTEARERAGLVP